MIGAIVLAAGNSSRLGQAKQLLPFRGQSLVRGAACVAIEAGCQPIVIVVGRDREQITTELSDLPATILPNENWQSGIGTSIRVGAEALAHDCDGIVILACDQPFVDSALIHQLIAAHEETQKPMAASAYAATLGVPALFARAVFPKLISLGDEEGAKVLLLSRPGDVALVNFPNGGIDIDTPEDYKRALREDLPPSGWQRSTA